MRCCSDGAPMTSSPATGRSTPPAPEGPIGQLFDRVPKYVASRNADIQLGWQGSSRVGADLPAELAALREKHQDVHVIGSVDFVQTLLDEQLYDVLQLWVYPIVLGQGKKVFPRRRDPAQSAPAACRVRRRRHAAVAVRAGSRRGGDRHDVSTVRVRFPFVTGISRIPLVAGAP